MSSSWSEGVPRDFSLEASKTAKTPEMMHLGCLLVLVGARPRTALWQTGGKGTHAVRSAVGRAVGRTAHTGGAGPRGTRCHRQYSFRRQPEVTKSDIQERETD